MEEHDNRPELPLDESQGELFDGPKEMQGELQPTQPKKSTPALEPEIYKKRLRGPLRVLSLPQIAKSAASIQTIFVVRHESPWDTFRKSYDCELGRTFEVASHKVRPSRLVAIRTIRERDIDTTLRLFETIEHPNILSSRDCFVHEASIFAVYDYQDIVISMDNLIACEAYLNEVELAAVLAQSADRAPAAHVI
ncbi:hypothetical protein EYZ11_011224 [Aspergillus tanneri]|uniref:Protein kinase domain-containing protein n=1 Tax=Aspergillus tanneri TaxID=1220188 RepID=A0A4S3J3E5_9EURO|nr:hypothetical protein EYZ11_011224 [Aspergillus tanneri]